MLRTFLSATSVIEGLVAAALWWYAGMLSVAREEEAIRFTSDLEKRLRQPRLAERLVGTNDFSDLFAAQGRANSVAAIFTAIAVLAQSIAALA